MTLQTDNVKPVIALSGSVTIWSTSRIMPQSENGEPNRGPAAQGKLVKN